MLSELCLVQSFFLPEDKTQVEEALPDYMKATLDNLGFVFSVYSAIHPAFIAGLDDLLTRKVYVRGVVDHTQQCGPAQARAWTPLLQKHGHDWVRFGTSPAGRKFINHEKVLVANAPVPGESLELAPINSITGFVDWRAALASGLYGVWDGSWNIGITADSQVNDVNVFVSTVRAATYAVAIHSHFQWIDDHEPEWNTLAESLAFGDIDGFLKLAK